MSPDLLGHFDPDVNLFNEQTSVANASYDYCSYFSIDSFIHLIKDYTRDFNFSILNFNIRSYHANYVHFEALLESLGQPFHVVVLTETRNFSNKY